MQIDPNYKSELVRVVVVEDTCDDSDLLVRQFAKNNFDGKVKVIRDGCQAWGFLASELSCMDLIALFLDVNLPSMSGIELLRKIKAHGGLRNIPVFVMSSSLPSQIRCECARLGAEPISKPVPYAVFAKAIANFFHATPAPDSFAGMDRHGRDIPKSAKIPVISQYGSTCQSVRRMTGACFGALRCMGALCPKASRLNFPSWIGRPFSFRTEDAQLRRALMNGTVPGSIESGRP